MNWSAVKSRKRNRTVLNANLAAAIGKTIDYQSIHKPMSEATDALPLARTRFGKNFTYIDPDYSPLRKK